MRIASWSRAGRSTRTTMPSGPICITMFSRENKAPWRSGSVRKKEREKGDILTRPALFDSHPSPNLKSNERAPFRCSIRLLVKRLSPRPIISKIPAVFEKGGRACCGGMVACSRVVTLNIKRGPRRERIARHYRRHHHRPATVISVEILNFVIDPSRPTRPSN